MSPYSESKFLVTQNSMFLFPFFLIFSLFFFLFSIACNLFFYCMQPFPSFLFSIARKPGVTPTSGVRSRDTSSKKHSCYTFALSGRTEYYTVLLVQVQCRSAGPTLKTIACNGFFYCMQWFFIFDKPLRARVPGQLVRGADEFLSIFSRGFYPRL